MSRSARPVSIRKFRAAVLSLYTPPIRAQSTYLKMRLAIDSIARLKGIKTTADLTTENVARWVASRKDDNPNTTISLLRALRTACRYAEEEGWIARTPVFRRIWPRKRPTQKRVLSHAEVCKLLGRLRERSPASWQDHRLYALAALIAYTGLRLGEASWAHVEDVDLERRVIWVSHRRRLKTVESAAPVPLARPVIPVLRAWLAHTKREGRGSEYLFPNVSGTGPWWGGAMGYRPLCRLQGIARGLGIPGATFHGLRHTLATVLTARYGRSREQVQWVLRHSDPRTTSEHYIHGDELDILHAVVDRLNFGRRTA